MSQTLTLADATGQLSRTFRQQHRADCHPSDAFFFLVGAGISAPEVPLAGEIEQSCQELAKLDDIDMTLPPNLSAMERYSLCLQSAFPHPVDRQRFFKRLIARRAISAANFRLAHLLASGEVPRLVVTPNFDDFLSRALTLFGSPHIVCDHPMSTERIDPERDDEVQILHVHGTYWFYDCCNLDGEIRSRANAGAVHQTVASRLDQILSSRSPIVLGYSGWEDDVIMTALRRRLSAPHPLPYLLYWFCFSADGAGALPAFVREHPQVRLVVPPDVQPGTAAQPGAKPVKESSEADDSASEPRSLSEEAPNMEAVSVLDELVRVLGIDTPKLTQNPIGFFADQLRASLPMSATDDGHGQTDDVYRLEHIVNRLDSLRDRWETRAVTKAGDAGALRGKPLERVHDALRRSQYADAVELAGALPLQDLDALELQELHETTYLAASKIPDLPASRIAGYEVALRAVDQLAAVDRERAASLAPARAMALVEIGIDHARSDRFDDAFQSFESVVESYADSSDPRLRIPVARALGNRGRTLSKLRRYREAIDVYDTVIEQHTGDPAIEIQRVLAKTRLNWANASQRLGRHAEAIACVSDVAAEYADHFDSDLRLQACRALLNKAAYIGIHEGPEEALRFCDEFLARYGHVSSSPVRELTAKALANKTFYLDRLERHAEAVQTAQTLLDHFPADDVDGEIAIQLCRARVAQGRSLVELDRPDDAEATWQAVIDWYTEHPDATTRGPLTRAVHAMTRLRASRAGSEHGPRSA